MNVDFSQERADYEAFCEAEPGVPLCCHPWYLDRVCQGGVWGAMTLLQDGAPNAAWPFFEKKRFGLRYVTMPQFTKYMGILCRSDAATATKLKWVEALLAAAPKWDGLDQQWSTSAESFISSLPASWKRSSYHTHQIQVRTDQDWRSQINRNMRRNIRKAEQQLQLRLDLDLQTFHQVSELSFQRQGLPLPYSYSALDQHDEALAQRGRRQIFAAVDETDRIHSVAYLMWSDTTAYYHLSGDDPELRRSGSGIWLIAQALDFAREKGLQTFDFEGSMIPAIAAIREQFGAERVPYSRVQMSRSTLYKALKWWRQRN
ncbi:MAG: GNAT family N-acetyltransferase [Bacteroidota bacterium]